MKLMPAECMDSLKELGRVRTKVKTWCCPLSVLLLPFEGLALGLLCLGPNARCLEAVVRTPLSSAWAKRVVAGF